MEKLSIRCVVLFACLFLIGGVLQAQEVTATLLGQVTDSTGAVVPGAVLTLTNTDKNLVVGTVKSDAKGEFTATLLPIGSYAILVQHEGFKELRRTGVELHVGDRVTLTLALQPGSVSTTVNVDEAAAQVQLQSSDSEQLISGQTIRALSISNRNFLALLTPLPGVSNTSATDEVPIGAVNPTGGVNALSFSLNGGRITMNSFLIDGADNMDRGANQTLVNTPSVDAVAEFKVVRGVYSAEYGRNASGQVNLITRSGASTFHGGAYEFFRNDILAANNALNNYKKIARPELRYNDFGWTLGGPVFIPNHYNTNRDKTFFFYSQELRRIITYTTTAGTLPSAAMEQGNFTASVCTGYSSSGACTSTGTSVPESAWSPVATAYIKDIFSKLPMGSAADAYEVVSTGRNTFNLSDLLARVDEMVTPREALTVRYMQDSGNTQEPYGYQVSAAIPEVSTTATSHPGTNIMARLTSTLRPNLMNEIAFALTFGRINSVPVGLLSKTNATDVKVDLPYQSTLGNVPYVSMTGLSRLSGYGPYDNHSRNYNVFDNVVSAHGRNTLKYGFTYNYYQKSEDNASTNAGSFSFTPASGGSQQSFANFLLGQQATFTQTSLDLTPDIRQNETELYVQDDFRWLPNLTINAGVRYSIFRVPTDARHMLTNFDPAKYVAANAPTLTSSGSSIVAGTGDPLNGIIVNGKTSPYGNAVSNEPGGRFAPRVGFSWDPTNKGKMAIRGGYRRESPFPRASRARPTVPARSQSSSSTPVVSMDHAESHPLSPPTSHWESAS
jgi:outer membrane receptor protein involved in Fe transport